MSDLNQLAGFLEPGRQVYFYYDDNGNRIQRTENGVVDTYACDYRARRVERVEGDTRTKIVFSGGTSVQEYEAVPCEEGRAGGQESGASGGQGCEELKVEYIRGSDYGGEIHTHFQNRSSCRTDHNVNTVM